MKDNQNITLQGQALQDLIEAVRPKPDAEKEALQQEKIENRKNIAQLAYSELKAREAERLACTHRRARDGSTRVVYVEGSHYLICQKCQCRIRPESDKHLPADVYNTRMFTELWAQASNQGQSGIVY